MEQLASKIVESSSDAIAVIRVDDDVIVDINEALFTITGYSHDELVGSLSHDLFVAIGPLSRVMVASRLRDPGSVGEARIGLRTRAGELRVGHLSALVIDTDQGRNAVCTIRDLRDPTLEERRLAAQERLTRTLRSDIPWPAIAMAALRAIGECLRWEFGALWLPDQDWSAVQRTVIWRLESDDVAGLEGAAQAIDARLGAGPIGRVWERGQAAWVRDVLEEAEFPDLRGLAGGPVHGWFAFPVWEADDVVGVVEFLSRQTRQPNPELLQATDEFGQAFYELLQRSTSGRAAWSGAGHDLPAVFANGEQPPSGIASSDLRESVEAVAAVAEIIERQWAPLRKAESPGLLRELTASVGKLNRVLEDLAGSCQSEEVPPAPAAVPVDRRLARGDRHPRAVLTLKAVSKRTGIPAATLRTWERRYQFTRPLRSATGYRLYSDEDVDRILQVKQLLEQGVRVSEATAALVEATGQGDAVLESN